MSWLIFNCKHIPEKDRIGLQLTLEDRSGKFNLFCQGANIDKAIGLSKENLKLGYKISLSPVRPDKNQLDREINVIHIYQSKNSWYFILLDYRGSLIESTIENIEFQKYLKSVYKVYKNKQEQMVYLKINEKWKNKILENLVPQIHNTLNYNLLQQRGTTGKPANIVPLTLLAKFGFMRPRVDNGSSISSLYFDKPIIKHRHVYSKVCTRMLLTYDQWVVSLLRDTKSKSNAQHAFIIVEGIDAFGYAVFRRYELGFNEQPVPSGYAHVTIKENNNVQIQERMELLLDKGYFNPKKGRGIDSVVGHAWRVSRLSVLDMERNIKLERGLSRYFELGDKSALNINKAHNCYTWAREKLIALNEPFIIESLPEKPVHYLATIPSFRLRIHPDVETNVRKISCPIM